MTPLFLTVNTTYTHVEVGLFRATDLIAHVAQSHKQVSATLLLVINDLLTNHGYTLQDLDFIAAQQGPAPFTTLRVALASVNGLAFATGIPLVGVDGLETFAREYSNTHYTYVLALLNAFCGQVYYGLLDTATGIFEKNCASADELIPHLAHKLTGPVLCIGQGLQLYSTPLEQSLGDRFNKAAVHPEYVSLTAVAHAAYNQWQNNKLLVTQLMPIYLKPAVLEQ